MRTIPEPNENDFKEALNIATNSKAGAVAQIAQLLAELRWLRNLQHPVDRPILCRIQFLNPAGNSWALFRSYYCALQYVLFLNEHMQDFALFRGDVTALHKTHSEVYMTITELEKLASEEE